MSNHANALAQLVERLTADLPFGPQPVEEELQTELNRLERSNQFFTLFEGDCDGRHGVQSVEVRQPTLTSLGNGKNGLVVLTAVSGVDEDAIRSAFPDLTPTDAIPRPGDPLDRIEYQALRDWGRLTVTVNRQSKSVHTLVLDTSP